MANYKKMVNGVEVELSDEEQALRESEEKTWADGAASRAFAALRAERDRKIAKTDWRAMPDLTLKNRLESHV